MSDDPVSADVYTEDYYLTCCAGSDTFDESDGLAVAPTVHELLDRAGVGLGTKVLDVGSGRGEVVLNAAKRGATAIGVDYAQAALSLAEGMLDRHEDVRSQVLYVRADAKKLPMPPCSVDVALMFDIVEHLQPWELDAALAETRRVLRPDGVLCVHTMPNAHFYRWVYPPLRLVARLVQGKRLPKDPRYEQEHQMHVNEQTPGALRRSLENAGFDAELWVSGFAKWPLDPGKLDYLCRGVAKRTRLRQLALISVFALARPR